MILHNGYAYRSERDLIDKVTASFCCPHKTCKGRITVAGETVTVKQKHEHPSDPEKVANRRILHKINERAANAMETLQKIVQIAQQNITEETAARAPLYRSLQRNIERKRKRWIILTLIL